MDCDQRSEGERNSGEYGGGGGVGEENREFEEEGQDGEEEEERVEEGRELEREGGEEFEGEEEGGGSNRRGSNLTDSIEWSHNLIEVHIPLFTSQVGPIVDMPETPLGVFELFFTSEIMDDIVTESNRYAKQVLGAAYDKYRPLTEEELRAYFGFVILMAVNHLPAADDYWKRDAVFNYSPVASRISCDRFVRLAVTYIL